MQVVRILKLIVHGKSTGIRSVKRSYANIGKGYINAYYAVKNETTYTGCISMVIDGGEYNSSINAIHFTSSGSMEVKNATISANSTAICSNSSGKVIINDTTILKANTGISNNSGEMMINNITMNQRNASGKPTISTYGISNGSGKVIIKDGEIYSSRSAVYCNSSGGNIEINGLKVASQDTSYGTIHNSSAGTINIKDISVSTATRAVENTGKGNIVIEKGNIETTINDSCINNTSTGVITIGTKDGVIDKESIQIKSAKIAVSSRLGSIKLYDGTLIGDGNDTLTGTCSEIEDNCYIVKETKADNLQYMTLGNPTAYVAKIADSYNPNVSSFDENSYKVEDHNYYFTTLEHAVSACSNSNASTIELIEDGIISRTLTTNADQDVTIEFNGKSIYSYSKYGFENYGDLYLKNDNQIDNQSGNIIQNGGQVVRNMNNASATIENMVIGYKSEVGERYYYSGTTSNERIVINNYGDMTISNVTCNINCKTNTLMYVQGIVNEQTGTMKINNITISGELGFPIENRGGDESSEIKAIDIKNSTISAPKGDGIINSGSGTILLDRCTVTTNSSNYNRQSGSVIIDNSTLSTGISNSNTGYVLIKGAESSLKYISNARNARLEIQGGEVTSSNSHTIDNSGSLTITGGTIICNSTSYNCIYNSSSYSTATISGASTKIKGKKCIYNVGTMEIKDAEITAESTKAIESKGTLILGTKDSNATFRPIIYGKTKGIENSGTFYFYDGIVDGPENNSITGLVPTDTENGCVQVTQKGKDESIFDDGTEDKYSIASGREISVLQAVNVVHVASIDRDFTSLEEAFENTNSTDTVSLIHDVSINGTADSSVVPEGKDITLDLNGYNISAGNSEAIVNNGTLKVTDSASHLDENNEVVEGKISSGANTIIKNNGTCTIEKGKLELTLGGASVSNLYNIIDNTGSLTINGGTYEISQTYCNIIKAISGNVTINDGIFNTNSSTDGYAIKNETAITTINGGSYTSKSGGYMIQQIGEGTINFVGGIVTGPGAISNSNNSGTINIRGGTINGVVCNSSKGVLNISGGTLNGTGDQTVYNYTSGTINITGGNIKGTKRAVKNSNSGTINIDGTELDSENPITITGYNNNSAYGVSNEFSGTINIKGHVHVSTEGSSGYAIYASSNGTINIGDATNINQNVKITGVNYAIYNNNSTYSNVNYYGGTITAKTAVRGVIGDIPEGYEIIKSVDENNSEVLEIGHTSEVALVGETKYDTLKEAIENCDNGKVVLLKDVAIPSARTMYIGNNQNVTLDLNSHIVYCYNGSSVIENSGILNIKDESSEDTGEISGYVKSVIKNNGILNISGGRYTFEACQSSEIINVYESGKVSINNGYFEIYSDKTYSSSARGHNIIYTENSEEVKITGGTFNIGGYSGTYSGSTWGHVVYATQADVTVSISNATFGRISGKSSGAEQVVYLTNGGNVNISGDTQINQDYGVYTNGSGEINISGNANLDCSSYSIYAYGYGNNKQTVININGGTLTRIYTYYYNSDTSQCTINVKGGNITGNGAISSYTTTANNILNIEGGTITSTSNGIYRIKTINMSGGEVVGYNYGIQIEQDMNANITGGKVSATNGPAIKLSSGTVTLGVNDASYPNQELPEIQGSTYGIENNNGTIDFYDGIIKGDTSAVSGIIHSTPELFEVVYSEDEKTATLGLTSTFRQVAKVNDSFYDDINSAIAAAIRANGKVEVCNNVSTSSGITIPAGASVTIDLCGYSINGFMESSALITNNGTLAIIDSKNDNNNIGIVRNYSGKAFINNGTLTIGENDGTVHTSIPKIIGKTITIENHGILNYMDGQIEILDETGDIIENDGTIVEPSGYTREKNNNAYTLVQQ